MALVLISLLTYTKLKRNRRTTMTTATPTRTPTEWPGAFGIYNTSKTIVMENLATFALLVLGAGAAGVFVGFIPVLGDIANLVIQTIAGVAVIAASFAGIRGNKMTFEQALSIGIHKMQPYHLI